MSVRFIHLVCVGVFSEGEKKRGKVKARTVGSIVKGVWKGTFGLKAPPPFLRLVMEARRHESSSSLSGYLSSGCGGGWAGVG